MYVIAFISGKRKPKVIRGDFPGEYLENLFMEGVQFVVISTYSNTVKVPYIKDCGHDSYVDYIQYDFDLKG